MIKLPPVAFFRFPEKPFSPFSLSVSRRTRV
jgi:hypothetical protein